MIKRFFYSGIITFLFTLTALAAQNGAVIADKAIIYADKERTSPIGFVRRGKTVRLGEISYNKGQVYPIIVSGKIAYISVIDVRLENEGAFSNRVTAERFDKSDDKGVKRRLQMSYLQYTSQVQTGARASNANLEDNDTVNWSGLEARADFPLEESIIDAGVVFNFLYAQEEKESFRVFQFGPAARVHLRDYEKLKLTFNFEFLIIPVMTYEVSGAYRARGYGFQTGADFAPMYYIGKRWGVEGRLGYHYMKGYDIKGQGAFYNIQPRFVGYQTALSVFAQF